MGGRRSNWKVFSNYFFYDNPGLLNLIFALQKLILVVMFFRKCLIFSKIFLFSMCPRFALVFLFKIFFCLKGFSFFFVYVFIPLVGQRFWVLNFDFDFKVWKGIVKSSGKYVDKLIVCNTRVNFLNYNVPVTII